MDIKITPTEELAKQYVGLKLFAEGTHDVIGEIQNAEVKDGKIEITGMLNGKKIVAYV